MAELVAAYFDCRRAKRNSASALAFELDLERNLRTLHEELLERSYRPGPSICFVVTRPRPREVWAAQFRDRVVHHLLYRRGAPRFEASFIADSCACIRGRGTLYAARRLEAKIRSATANWSRPAWYLKCDVANFFVTIDKTILRELLAARVREPWWTWLTDLILLHDPRPGVVLQGPAALFARVPPYKRLAQQGPQLGLPIGNLSSQFFANVYLNELDRFVKHELRMRHYIRYVDDLVLLDASPQRLNEACAAIDGFLQQRLLLRLNPAKTVLQPVARGIDFVGHVLRPWRRTLRRRTFRAALARLDHVPAEELLHSANSYFGLLRQVTKGHADRCEVANLVRRRGHSVDRALTKAFALIRR